MPLRRGCRTLSTAPCLPTYFLHTYPSSHTSPVSIYSSFHFLSPFPLRLHLPHSNDRSYKCATDFGGGFHFAKIIISTVRDKNTGLRKRLAFPNWQKYKIMQNHSIFRIPCVTDKEIVKILALQALCLFVPRSIPYLSLVFVLYCDYMFDGICVCSHNCICICQVPLTGCCLCN